MKPFGRLKNIESSNILSVCFPILVCLFSWQSIDPVLLPRYIFTVSVALFFLIAISIKNDSWGQSINFLKSQFALPFYLFIGTAGISLLNASAITEGLFTFSTYVLFFVLLLIIIKVIKDDTRRLLSILKGLVIGALIISGSGFYQLYVLNPQFPIPLDDLYLIKSTLAHKNLFASASLFFFFFALLGIKEFKKAWRILAVLASASTLFFVILLQARSSLLALAVAIFAGIAIIISTTYLPRFIKWLSFKMLWILGVMLLLSFSVLYFTQHEKASSLDFASKVEGNDERSFTVKERSLMWEASLNMALHEDFLGVGPGNWKIHFPNYGSGIWRARQGLIQFQRPHNDYLWVLTESGILGLVAYLLMFGTILLMGLKAQIFTSSKTEIWILRTAMLSIVAYMVVAVFSFPRERMLHQWLLTFSFAAIISIYLKNKTATSHKPIGLSIPLLILLIPMLFIGYQRFEGEKISQQILVNRKEGTWKALLANNERVEKLTFYDMDPMAMPLDFYAGLAHLSLENYDTSLVYFNRAHCLHPYNIHVINNLGGIHQLLDNFEETLFYYELAVKIAPYYQDGILNLSAAYFNYNKPISAYKILQENESKFEENKAVFQVYLTTILRTLFLNFLETNQLNLTSTQEISDAWLMKCHELATKQNIALNEAIRIRLKEFDN